MRLVFWTPDDFTHQGKVLDVNGLNWNKNVMWCSAHWVGLVKKLRAPDS
jgi:hypothetical protein